MSDEDKLKLKIVLGGDGAVGKTSLRKKYMGESFEVEYIQTIGADFGLYETKIGNIAIKFQIWDLKGQPLFREAIKAFYEEVVGAIMVYDITRPETLDNLKNWIADLFNRGGLMPVVIVGNKNDLERMVPPEMGRNFVTEMNNTYNTIIHFLETSAKTGENVKEAFETLGKAILDKIDKDSAKITS